MNIRKFVEDFILESAKIVEENRELKDEIDDLQYMNDEYEQFIGEMGMEDLFFDRIGSGYSGRNYYGYPNVYDTTYPRAYDYRYQYGNSKEPLEPGEIDVAALTLGLAKMERSVGDEKSTGII